MAHEKQSMISSPASMLLPVPLTNEELPGILGVFLTFDL